jgi:hypothetical protein
MSRRLKFGEGENEEGESESMESFELLAFNEMGHIIQRCLRSFNNLMP